MATDSWNFCWAADILTWGISHYFSAFHFHVQSSAYLCPDPCLSPVSYHIPSPSSTEASVFRLIPLHSALHGEHFIFTGQYLSPLVLQRGCFSLYENCLVLLKQSTAYYAKCRVAVFSLLHKLTYSAFSQHGMVTNHLRAVQRLPQYTPLFCCYKRSCHNAHLSQVLQLAYRTTKKNLYIFFQDRIFLFYLEKNICEGLTTSVTLVLFLCCWISRVVHLLPHTQKLSSHAWVREAPEQLLI